MSLNSEKSRVQYEGNGSATKPYPVTFVFYDAADLKVVVTNAAGVDTMLSPGVGYAVTGAGSPYGGNVLTTLAYDATHKVTIYREVEATQKTVYEENADFPAKSHERALDKLTMLVQQISRKVKQSLRFRESDGETQEAARVASSLFGLSADGAPLFRTADEVASFLNLTQQYYDRPIKTFLDAAERALAVPEYIGQIGSQRDDVTLWFASGLGAGDWTQAPYRISSGMLLDGILENSTAGRAKMANGYLSADAVGRAKMADAYLTLAKVGAGIFTADGPGRAPFSTGYVNAPLCSAGLWAAIAPAGAVLNSVQATPYTALSTFSVVIPTDNTVPTVTEGAEVQSVTITPTLPNSLFRLRFTGMGSCSAGGSGYGCIVAGFRGSLNVGASFVQNYGNYYVLNLATEFFDTPGTLSPVTYSIRVGPQAGVMCVNSAAGTGLLGAAASLKLVVEEIKA